MNHTHRTNPETNAGIAGTSILSSLRSFVPQRQASSTEALRIAELQAQRLLHRCGIDDGPVSDDLLLELPRIAIEYVHDMPTSGCSFWNTERANWIIQVNASEPATRQRFTLFHEYKHIVDHGQTDRLYGMEPEAAKRAEQAADFFAGCVLMPRPLVKRAWCRGIQTARGLATAFDVSPVAAGVRLAQIGLTDQPARCTVAVDTAPTHRTAQGRPPRRFGSYHRQLSMYRFALQEAS
jgi:Zn-dependent peptidase ImmA (M78 family)